MMYFETIMMQLKTFFNAPHVTEEEKDRLWDILSALRGPDTGWENEQEKEATTAVIRQAFLGEGFQHGLAPGGAIVNRDGDGYLEKRQAINLGTRHVPGHFLNHVKKAFVALNLKWDEVNP